MYFSLCVLCACEMYSLTSKSFSVNTSFLNLNPKPQKDISLFPVCMIHTHLSL